MNKKKGITLIEILLVVAILSVIVSVLGYEVRNYWEDSRKNLTLAQLGRMRKILHQYANDRFDNEYPIDFRELIENGYLPNVPVNPLTNEVDWQVRPRSTSFMPRDPELDENWYELKETGEIGDCVDSGGYSWDDDYDRVFDIRIPPRLTRYSMLDTTWKSASWD
ncbi:MAG: type II secretion system protein [Candidatus Muiribacteriota bacterium]